ncbi:MAG: hypothetical protein U5R30_20505 [Deltaproteobacteria bacterium]|nr:hypothetical protein [Deltaproteobacteria bacterium]
MIEELSPTFAVVYGLAIKALQQAFITHQRVDFSLAKLTKPFPEEWSEHRSLLGFGDIGA